MKPHGSSHYNMWLLLTFILNQHLMYVSKHALALVCALYSVVRCNFFVDLQLTVRLKASLVEDSSGLLAVQESGPIRSARKTPLMMSWLPFCTICIPSTTTGMELFCQLYTSKDPFATQVRITVLLNSTASGRLAMIFTSATGSAGDG